MHNDQSLAPTLPSEPRYKVELSEADYLAREVEDAKAALQHAVADLKNGLSTTADLRLWVKHYPWAALGAATVAGFAAAAAVTPARGESLGEKLSQLKPSADKSASADSSSPPAEEAKKNSTVKSSLMDSLFDVATTLLQTVLLATLRGQGAATSVGPNIPAAASGDPWHVRAG